MWFVFVPKSLTDLDLIFAGVKHPNPLRYTVSPLLTAFLISPIRLSITNRISFLDIPVIMDISVIISFLSIFRKYITMFFHKTENLFGDILFIEVFISVGCGVNDGDTGTENRVSSFRCHDWHFFITIVGYNTQKIMIVFRLYKTLFYNLHFSFHLMDSMRLLSVLFNLGPYVSA